MLAVVSGCGGDQENEAPSLPFSTGFLEYDAKKFCQAEAVSPTLIMTAAHCAHAINVEMHKVTFVYANKDMSMSSIELYSGEAGPGSLWVEKQEAYRQAFEEYPKYYQVATDKFYLRLKEALPEHVVGGIPTKLNDVSWEPYNETKLLRTGVFFTDFQKKEHEYSAKRVECNVYRFQDLQEVVFNDCPSYRGNSGAGLRSIFDETKIVAVISGEISKDFLKTSQSLLAKDLVSLANAIGRTPDHAGSMNSMGEFCNRHVMPCGLSR